MGVYLSALSLSQGDILIINTIWLSRYEVYLPHIHEHNLLREKKTTEQEKSRAEGGGQSGG